MSQRRLEPRDEDRRDEDDRDDLLLPEDRRDEGLEKLRLGLELERPVDLGARKVLVLLRTLGLECEPGVLDGE